ncbi:hypothetical protein JAAARDRAFT_46817 [Jaapia argillacea MUCL 33604]|uniref:Uncharacterized protein n=1 Tax=Jaapia argillacea MUCL 33604 TaxID=933084 RepID=A0A067Q9V6_9AGAM|nr:hypothetical protein JAAARDRAFT_46817 [Jaapia argillacea MUCL 33604]
MCQASQERNSGENWFPAGAVEITGNKTATMQYVNYECDIIQKYEIILEGWTHEKFVNLSKLSDALEPLQNLLDALHKGTCKFIKLSTAQQEQRHEEFNARVEAGKAEAPQPWKQRKDAGKKRPQASDDTDKENGREDSAPPAKKTRRKKRTAPTSTAVVADGADA